MVFKYLKRYLDTTDNKWKYKYETTEEPIARQYQLIQTDKGRYQLVTVDNHHPLTTATTTDIEIDTETDLSIPKLVRESNNESRTLKNATHEIQMYRTLEDEYDKQMYYSLKKWSMDEKGQWIKKN